MIGPDTRQTPARLGQQIITLFNSNVSMFPSTIHHPYCPRPTGPRTASDYHPGLLQSQCTYSNFLLDSHLSANVENYIVAVPLRLGMEDVWKEEGYCPLYLVCAVSPVTAGLGRGGMKV